jgi:hypothetical protein
MNTSRLRIGPRHIIADNGDATGETMLIAQTLENAGGSVSLLAVHLAVIHQDLVDDLGIFRQLAAVGLPTPAMRPGSGKHSILSTVLRLIPKYRAAARRLIPSISTARRTF